VHRCRRLRAFHIRARVLVFDFSSLISESSFLSMIKAVAPRNLALLQRSAADATFLPRAHDALSGLRSHVHAPVATAPVTLSSTACYVATLDAPLAAALAAAPHVLAPPYRLGWLDAVVTGTEAHTARPILGLPPPGAADRHSAAGVFVGAMLVSDVTQRLKRRGLAVEQDGAAAVVADGAVVVRAAGGDARDHLVIEGALSPMYFEVREAVYSLYQLAGAQER
jgi:Cleavage and polyadenylation factor 2 C-terminal